MLSREDNELLVRTNAGTPMGTLFRRFWVPVMLEDELGGADSTPVRVEVLGEKLVAFRDSAGKIGLLNAYCPHRRANLFWGRNEEHGLRCIYHGWKFDVGGQCVDMPNCPEGSTLKDRVKTVSYPALARGGIVWAYMGPAERMPAFPDIEILQTPPSHRCVRKMILKSNYLQAQEGDMDSSHVSFLHSRLDKTALYGSLSMPTMFEDTSPRWFVNETDYGLMFSAQRDAGDDKYQWRVTQYLMPCVSLIAAPRGERMLANIRVPIDDERSLLFRCFVHPDRPLNEEERTAIESGVIAAEMIAGTFYMKENMDNDYLIDREAQRTETFTGVKSIVAQDVMVTEDQAGSIADRSLEYLVSSDRAIIALRKKLLARVKGLLKGVEPPEASNASAYGVRAVDFYLPRDVSVEDGAKELLLAGTR
jgi:phenylpropionate dioxygenase-like ring-hydroxylating dioxygenase large terminal subunit